MTEQKTPNQTPSGLPRLRSATALDYFMAHKGKYYNEDEYRRALAEGLKGIVADDNKRVVEYFLTTHPIDDVLDAKKVPKHSLDKLQGVVTLYELLSAQINKNKKQARKGI